MNTNDLEKLLHTKIPMSQFMDVHVVQADEHQIQLTCPLSPNHNHLGTAFGGSLSNLMTLAAYCQIFQLIEGTGHVVLKTSTSSYKHPVNETLRSICPKPSSDAVKDFQAAYKKKGRARLTLESYILLSDGRIACSMVSEFVGIL